MRRLASIAVVLIAGPACLGVARSGLLERRGATRTSSARSSTTPRSRSPARTCGSPARRSARSSRSTSRAASRSGPRSRSRSTTRGFTPFYANATCAIRPQSLIGEKYVDCEPGHLERAAADADHERARHRQLLPAGHADELAGRLGHRPGHLPGADPRAVRADPRRARHRAGGARLGPERRHPPRQPSARRDRQGAPDPRAAEPAARAARDRLGRGADAAGEGHATRSPTSSSRRTRPRSRAPRGRPTVSRSIQLFPPFLSALRPLMVELGDLADAGDAADGELARPERDGARPPVPEPDAVRGGGPAGADRARQLLGAVDSRCSRRRCRSPSGCGKLGSQAAPAATLA